MSNLVNGSKRGIVYIIIFNDTFGCNRSSLVSESFLSLWQEKENTCHSRVIEHKYSKCYFATSTCDIRFFDRKPNSNLSVLSRTIIFHWPCQLADLHKSAASGSKDPNRRRMNASLLTGYSESAEENLLFLTDNLENALLSFGSMLQL